MKKRGNKLLGLFLLTIMLSVFLVGTISAQGFFKTKFYETIKPYIVPNIESGVLGDVGEFSALIIGIISLVILFFIFWDILTLIPVFSKNTMRVIAIGLGIIMILFKWNVTVASIIFSWGAALFGWAGSLAVAFIIIAGIIVMVGIMFGLSWVTDRLQNIRTTRDNAEAVTKAKEKGGKIRALSEMAEEVEK